MASITNVVYCRDNPGGKYLIHNTASTTTTTRLSCFGVKTICFVFVSKLPMISKGISEFVGCIRFFKRLSKIEIRKNLNQI